MLDLPKSSMKRPQPQQYQQQASLQKQPASALGQYHVIKDIAEGTFGKVKSTCAFFFVIMVNILNWPSFVASSGQTHPHRSKSSHEISLKGSHRCLWYQNSCFA